jgi:DNA-binding transcriptional MerR regulator
MNMNTIHRPGISHMYTISRLAGLFKLSRSTLLYYDRLGLLRASGRSTAGYRIYSEEDKERLRQIVLFRDIGLPLEKIKEYLDAPQRGVLPLLFNRLFSINNRITELREQQNIILTMIEIEGSLKGKKSSAGAGRMAELQKQIGIDQNNYKKIHSLFEEASPVSHRKLLSFLGFSEKEIGDFIEALKEQQDEDAGPEIE